MLTNERSCLKLKYQNNLLIKPDIKLSRNKNKELEIVQWNLIFNPIIVAVKLEEENII